MAKEIKLTKGMVALVDDEDYDRVLKFKWYAKYSKNYGFQYAVRTNYEGKKQNGKLFMHKFITNCPENKVVHHIDGNGFNNQKSNLMVLTPSEHKKLHAELKNNKS